jgi:hypothetical protein
VKVFGWTYKTGFVLLENFFVAARRYWKASFFFQINLIEMYNFWSEHKNSVHLEVKSFSLPPGATEKLVLQKST